MLMLMLNCLESLIHADCSLQGCTCVLHAFLVPGSISPDEYSGKMDSARTRKKLSIKRGTIFHIIHTLKRINLYHEATHRNVTNAFSLGPAGCWALFRVCKRVTDGPRESEMDCTRPGLWKLLWL